MAKRKITFEIEEEMFYGIEDYADGRPKSVVLRRAVKELLEKEKNKGGVKK